MRFLLVLLIFNTCTSLTLPPNEPNDCHESIAFHTDGIPDYIPHNKRVIFIKGNYGPNNQLSIIMLGLMIAKLTNSTAFLPQFDFHKYRNLSKPSFGEIFDLNALQEVVDVYDWPLPDTVESPDEITAITTDCGQRKVKGCHLYPDIYQYNQHKHYTDFYSLEMQTPDYCDTLYEDVPHFKFGHYLNETMFHQELLSMKNWLDNLWKQRIMGTFSPTLGASPFRSMNGTDDIFAQLGKSPKKQAIFNLYKHLVPHEDFRNAADAYRQKYFGDAKFRQYISVHIRTQDHCALPNRTLEDCFRPGGHPMTEETLWHHVQKLSNLYQAPWVVLCSPPSIRELLIDIPSNILLVNTSDPILDIWHNDTTRLSVFEQTLALGSVAFLYSTFTTGTNFSRAPPGTSTWAQTVLLMRAAQNKYALNIPLDNRCAFM
eukprot:m.344332 g.344332  ORF g.344332 m.344332 type:complete len:429 (-) comp24208_c0_seq1:13-1299(-)